MKLSLKWLALFLAIITMAFTAKASDIGFIQPNIPTELWEEHPEGISLVITLSSRIEKQIPNYALRIYIKNTSPSIKGFSRNNADLGMKIFYIDSHNDQIPLHNYPNAGIDYHRFPPVFINPGETLSVTIDLNASEATLLTSHPVKCSMLVYNPATKQQSTIESSPRQLTETSGK